MTAIQNAAWTNTKFQVQPTATQKDFSNTIHQNEQTKENDDGTKTIIERSVVAAGDGSQMVILTSVTLGADGKRLDTKVISRMKIGKDDIGAQPLGTVSPETGDKPDAAEKVNNSSPIKNVAGKEYEQNSITGTFDPGLVFNADI